MDHEHIELNNQIKEPVEMMRHEALADEKNIPEGQPRLMAGWLDFSNSSYVKGFLIAAGVTLIATHPKVRETIARGAIKTWTTLQGGVEEFKEKIHDVRAEMSQEPAEKHGA